MTNPRVYIPSRGRWENVPKLVKAWDDSLFDVVFMVEPDEAGKYLAATQNTGVNIGIDVLALPDRNLGVGFSRTACLEHAADAGFKSIIVSDDDIKPKDGMDYLIDTAEDPMVLGITAYYSYLDLMLGIKGKDRNDVIMSPSCIVRMFGLNVENSLDLGGFDANLKCLDDGDFMVRGIIESYPWLIHLGAKAVSFAPRHAVGGVEALGSEALSEAVNILHKKYPDFTTKMSDSKLRYKWRALFDEYLGPNWKQWSAVHGGDIKNYFEGEA